MINFKDYIDYEDGNRVEATRINLEKLFNDPKLKSDFISYLGNKSLIVLNSPRVDEIAELQEEAFQRVYVYNNYANTENLDILSDYCDAWDLNLDGSPKESSYINDSSYWKGVLAACKYIGGFNLNKSIEDIRNGDILSEDIL